MLCPISALSALESWSTKVLLLAMRVAASTLDCVYMRVGAYRSKAGVMASSVIHELAVLVRSAIGLVVGGLTIAHASESVRVAATITLVLL